MAPPYSGRPQELRDTSQQRAQRTDRRTRSRRTAPYRTRVGRRRGQDERGRGGRSQTAAAAAEAAAAVVAAAAAAAVAVAGRRRLRPCPSSTASPRAGKVVAGGGERPAGAGHGRRRPFRTMRVDAADEAGEAGRRPGSIDEGLYSRWVMQRRRRRWRRVWLRRLAGSCMCSDIMRCTGCRSRTSSWPGSEASAWRSVGVASCPARRPHRRCSQERHPFRRQVGLLARRRLRSNRGSGRRRRCRALRS
jgi:hypothetical protein